MYIKKFKLLNIPLSGSTSVPRCQYVEKPGYDLKKCVKTIPSAAYADTPVLMTPRFKRNPAGKWILKLELFLMQDIDSSFDAM